MEPRTFINRFVWQFIAVWWFVQGFFCYGYSDMIFATIGGSVMIIAFILFVTRYRVVRSICSFMLFFYTILFFALSILLFRNYDVRAASITMFCISAINVPVIVYALKETFMVDIKQYNIFGGRK